MVEEVKLEREEQEFLEWLSLPATQKFKRLLAKWQENLKDQWASGAFVGEDKDSTLMANAAALGEVNLLKRIIELEYWQISEGLDDGE